MRNGILALGLLCACSFPGPPTLLPPPFGPNSERPSPAQFFFPAGIAIHPGDASTPSYLLVSNANSDRAFDAGAVYAFRSADLINQYFIKSGETLPFPESARTAAAMIGSYTGPLLFSGTTAYTGSRDTNRMNAVVLGSDGSLSCRDGANTATGVTDCRSGVIDLSKAADLEGPFALANARVRPLGAAVDVDAILVGQLIPHVDDIVSGVAFTSSRVGALSSSDPSVVLFSALATDRVSGAGVGGSSLVFDDVRRQAIVAGCYQRFASASQGGEPSTSKCIGFLNTNVIRFVPVDAGSAAVALQFDLGPQLHGTETAGLALGDPSPDGSRILFATIRNPDLLAEIRLPADPGAAPALITAISLPSSPARIVHIARPTPGPELLAISVAGVYPLAPNYNFGSLVIFDATSSQVVAQVSGLGDTPYEIAQFPPAASDTSARLAVTVWGSCRISLVEVPFDRPSTSQLRANLGSCP
jgi:hypothetical protein